MSASTAADSTKGAQTVPFVTRPHDSHTDNSDGIQRFPIQFTGSGSEYFRIWIVNLLLTLLTLGLYFPWAKVRKLRYLYGNTVIADHPLSFHGDPKRMARGYALMAALLMAYSLAGRFSDTAGALAGLILAGLWPMLFRAAMQFKLANTSWRGMRFRFTGSVKDAYMVVLMPIGIVVGSVALVGILTALFSGGNLKITGSIAFVAAMLVGYLMLPYTLWRLKKYQHDHYALAQWQTGFRASFKSFVGVFARTGLVGIASMLLALTIFGIVVSMGGASFPSGRDAKPLAVVAAMAPLLILFVLASQILPGPYFVSRMQNLVWTNTGNGWIRFKSNLTFAAMLRLTVKNWFLVLITLGLYWPFAAMATAKAKLTAISVHTRVSPDQLAAQASAQFTDAAGEAAADLLGMDFGL